MREIRFRAKEKDNNTWVFGVPMQCHDGMWQMCKIPTRHTIDINTIGQFTNYYDKMGRPIYEGDVIEWTEACDGGSPYTMREEVRFVDGGFYPLTKLIIYNDELPSVRVIGNVYDNKELLNEEI